MASQLALFAETIASMKKAVKRKAYGGRSPMARPVYDILLTIDCCPDSDSDSSIEQLTNRGNKLRKKARYVRGGQLAPPNGPQVYKRVRDCPISGEVIDASADDNARELNTQVFKGTL